MDEKPNMETIKKLTDTEIYDSITKQDAFLSSLTNQELIDYKTQKAQYSLRNDFINLSYFGAKHIFEPTDPQFDRIDAAFNTFIDGKDFSQIVVLVEGSIPDTSASIDEDIHFRGERGFITHLAREKGIEVKCHEPDRVSEMRYLLTEFKPHEIEYYYYLRAIRDYFRLGRIQDQTSFEEYSNRLLEIHKKLYSEIEEFSNFDFSLENIKQIHKSITGTDFEVNNRPDINPTNRNTVVNMVSKASSTYRDFYHVKSIERELESGKMVFVVNGEDHAVVQRPSLEKMFS